MNYLDLIMIILSIAFFYSPYERKRQKWLYIVMCLGILFCTCCRTISTRYDTYNYVQFFKMTHTMSLKKCLEWNTFEPGYVILNKLISKFTNNERIFLTVISLFILVPILMLIWRKSSNPLLSLLIFVAVGNLHSTFAALRQWCAVAVLALGYDFIEKRKVIPFLITVLISYYFHKTAIFILPLFLLYPIRMSRHTLLLSITMAISCFLFQDEIMSVLNIFARLETETTGGSGYVQLLTFWGLIIIIEIVAAPIKNFSENKLCYMALVYSAIIQPLCLKYGPFARIHLYCWYGTAFSIPGIEKYMARNYDLKNNYILKLIIMVVMALWYIVTSDEKTLTLIF